MGSGNEGFSFVIFYYSFIIVASSSTKKPTVLSRKDSEAIISTTKDTPEEVERLFCLFMQEFPRGSIFRK